MSLVDANVVLRYLLDDHAELSAQAADILERQSVIMPMEVACEVVYVLQKVYGVERQDIQEQLSGLVDEALVTMDKPAVFLKRTPCSGPIESLKEKRSIPSTRRSASIYSAQMSADPCGFRQCPLEVLHQECDGLALAGTKTTASPPGCHRPCRSPYQNTGSFSASTQRDGPLSGVIGRSVNDCASQPSGCLSLKGAGASASRIGLKPTLA